VFENSSDFGTIAILLLEQDAGSLDIVRQSLPGIRIHALPRAELQYAPDFVSREQVALVFDDLTGAGPACFACQKQLQRVHPDLDVISVVADGDVGTVLNAFREGACDVLVMPLSPSDVCRALARVQRRSWSQQESVEIRSSARRTLDELVLLRSISETASDASEPQKLLDQVTALIRQALRVEIVSLMLTDETGDLYISAAAGLPPDVVENVRVPRTEGIAGRVLESGEAVLVDDLASDGRFAPREFAGRYRTGSLLSVPISCHGQVFGVLNVNNKASAETFTGEDRELLQSIAHQAALAIENFRLVDRIRRQSAELERVHEDFLVFHRDRARFVSSLSHELKTPLTSVLGFAELMVEMFDQLEPAKLYEFIAKLHTEAKRLETLLSGMLQLFSIDSGSEEWHWEPVDFGCCVVEACQRHEIAMAEMDLGLELSMPENLLPIWAARDKVGILLDALLDHSIKFNCTGGTIRLSAENRCEAGREQVYFGIVNQGQAFPTDKVEAFLLKDPVQCRSDTGSSGLVGINLATCRAILHAMHGRVLVEKSGAEGTSLAILLPTQPYREGA
jgi:K+-sensing histidine kinase KdpD